MDKLGFGAELGGGVGHAVVKACANGQYHVGVVHGHIGFVKCRAYRACQGCAHNAWVATNAHQGGGNGVVQAVYQGA